MSYTPIPLFNRIPPNDIVNALNTLVNEINANFMAAGFLLNGTVTRRQFFLALANSNLMTTAVAGIPANSNDPVYIQFVSGATVTPNDALASNVKTTLGYTSAQMTALFALAATENP